jgi:Zn-dependent M28 family amino/carboxypeptidase
MLATATALLALTSTASARDTRVEQSLQELVSSQAAKDAGIDGSERQNALLAAGASAVLTVLDGDRSLENVAARRQRSGYALASETLGGDLEGFVTAAGMRQLLQAGGQTLPALEQDAAKRDFAPRMLDLTATLEATTRETTIHTHNVIGKLPGRHPEAGAVLFVAHWDHFGICAQPPAEDVICNGAIDNASGVAALTEIARRLARGPQPDRDIYFLATTAEELGLLGAHAFAENPPLPLDRIVAAFNIDSVALAPAGTPLAIVGKGMTALDPQIAAVARAQKRRIVDGNAANAYFRRQDGWALLQHDVPTVMVTSAYAETSRVERFFEGSYHRPSDNPEPSIELGGAAEDVAFLAALGRWFGDVKRVPVAAK